MSATRARWWAVARAAAITAVGAGLVTAAAYAGSGPAALVDPTLDLAALAAPSDPAAPADPAATADPAGTADPAAAQRLPGVAATSDPADVLARRSVLGCAGPHSQGLAGAPDEPTDQAVHVLTATAPRRALPAAPRGSGTLELSAVPDGPQLRASSRGAGPTATLSGARGAVVDGSGAVAPGLAAAQWQLSTGEQRRGLEVAACPPPVQEAWLLGGGAAPGRVERLVLVNPGANAVTADVAVLGSQGLVAGAGGRGVVVPAGGRVVLALDALAGPEKSPVLHVTATGGPLVAALGERWLDGTTDKGTDLTTPAAGPALEQVVPVLPGAVAGDRVTTTLRLAVPGDRPAVVQLRELRPDGAARPAPDVVRVGAGRTLDVAVAGLSGGPTALQVVADVPVVAAVQVTTEGAPRRIGDATGSTVSELAWVPSSEPVQALAGTPLPVDDRVTSRLVLSSVTGAEAEVLTTAGGRLAAQRVEVAPGGTSVVELGAAGDVWVRPLGAPVHAGVVTTAADETGPYVAVVPLQDAAVERRVLSVRPWRP